MGNTLYQIVYKSSYHGELFSDSRAISLNEPCPTADIMEIIKIDVPEEMPVQLFGAERVRYGVAIGYIAAFGVFHHI